jgi:hypothetical protein
MTWQAEGRRVLCQRACLSCLAWISVPIPIGITDWVSVRARRVNEWAIWLLGQYSDCYAGILLAWILHLPPSAVPLVGDVRFRRSA